MSAASLSSKWAPERRVSSTVYSARKRNRLWEFDVDRKLKGEDYKRKTSFKSAVFIPC